MCGIVAILSRPRRASHAQTPTSCSEALDAALAAARTDGSPLAAALDAVAGRG